IGKDGAYDALLHLGAGIPWLLVLLVAASVLLGLAGLVAGVAPFLGRAPLPAGVHDPEWRLWLPPLVLASAGVMTGFAPPLLNAPISAAVATIAGSPTDVSLHVWHGLTTPLLLSALTLAAVVAAYAARNALRTRAWLPRYGAEDLYAASLSGLDAVSHRIAPALHSASLRNYVMVIVASSALIGGTALAVDPDLGAVVPRTSITLPDVLIVVVIAGGALSAVAARSTMTAVLSLGAVGYGVAMMFLTFGAPDLAMTQFSVETLTVLIYVLVFRHFRGLGPLSPPLIRARDALIALGIGTVVGGLLLSIATAETAPRLREYFAEFGPTLGHGRNIVNVILVDFRGIDTLGEITVLATAAIGVRALLRLAGHSNGGDTAVPDRSPIFRTAARLLMPLLLVFSVFLLLRGHNQPGGGFVGGLVAAAAFSLYAIAFGVARARQALLVRPMTLLGTGLLMAVLSGLPAVVRGRAFLTAQWAPGPLLAGTPTLFDLGVFFVVAGVVMMMIFTLAEEA
ncbi:MAG TPA: Na+/H+ antiporter subunit B, partial [Vicinamibacterales bacterium]